MSTTDFDSAKSDITEETDFCQTAVDLKKYLKSSVDSLLRIVSEEKFIQIYKTCYKEFTKKDEIDRPSLSGSSVEARSYRSQLIDIMSKNTFETIDETVSNLNPQLKELEDFKKNQSDNAIVWRPPGDAFEHMTPFEYAYQMEKKKQLEKIIEHERESLETLKARLIYKRNEVKELHEVLLTLIDNVKKIVTNEVNE